MALQNQSDSVSKFRAVERGFISKALWVVGDALLDSTIFIFSARRFVISNPRGACLPIASQRHNSGYGQVLENSHNLLHCFHTVTYSVSNSYDPHIMPQSAEINRLPVHHIDSHCNGLYCT